MLRAGLFERVSTEEQVRFGFSIRTQIDALTEYCTKADIKIVDHYTDEGVSAGRQWRKRPEMVRLIDDVVAGKIDIILFTRLDRWFRNVSEYFKVQEILDKHNVQWKAIWEDYDTSTANGRMAITIFLAINQNEREKTAERITAVLSNKVKNGEACFGGSVKPLGYMKQTDENGVARLVKDPSEQEMVQDFWDTLLQTNNFNATIRKMGSEYGIYKDWKSWKRMTKNTFYCGQYKDNKDYCEPYITPEQFQKWQESRPVKKTPSGNVYIFRGMMRCEKCGNLLCGASTKRKDHVWKSYRCKNRGRGCDNHSSYAEKKLEKMLISKMHDFITKYIADSEHENKLRIQKPKSDASKLKEQLRRLNTVYMTGNMPDEDYITKQAELKEKIKEAEENLPPKPIDLTNLKKLQEIDFEKMYQTLEDDTEKQQLWQGLIKAIHLNGHDVSSVEFV